MPPTAAKVPTATTPSDNGYDPQCGAYDPCYSGDLDKQDREFEARDARVAATRAEFARSASSSATD